MRLEIVFVKDILTMLNKYLLLVVVIIIDTRWVFVFSSSFGSLSSLLFLNLNLENRLLVDVLRKNCCWKLSQKNISCYSTAQKMKFSIKDFFSKCDQICRKLRIWSHLRKNPLMENFIFCAVQVSLYTPLFHILIHRNKTYWSYFTDITWSRW